MFQFKTSQSARILVVMALLAAPVTSLLAKQKPVIEELDSVIATVNNDVITLVELNKRINQIISRLKDTKTRIPPRKILIKKILEQLVLEKIQLQLAQRVGVRIDDETINNVIAKIARDNHLTLIEFRDTLKRDGYEFSEFRDQIRNEMIITQLRKRRVQSHVVITEQEVTTQLENQLNNQHLNDSFHMGHILIATPESATPEQIEAAKRKAAHVIKLLKSGADFAETAIEYSNGQRALKGGDLGWRQAAQLPTVFGDIVAKLNAGEFSQPIRSASGFHIVKVFQRRNENKSHIVQQTHARHILITPNQIQGDTQVKEKLRLIRERLLAGESFAELAKASSDDKSSAVRGGDLGWLSPGVTVSEFEEQMNKLAINEISQPFKSRYGWHIIQVLGRRQFDDTKNYKRLLARKQIGQRKTEIAVENWLRRLRDEAYVEYHFNK